MDSDLAECLNCYYSQESNLAGLLQCCVCDDIVCPSDSCGMWRKEKWD